MIFLTTVLALFALLILGTPIAIALMISGLVGYVLTIDFEPGLNALAQIAYGDLNSFVIGAIPLYVLMGQIMLKGGAGKDLFDLAQRVVGRLPGGLGVAAIFACAIFAAISGSSTATVATIGSISIPEMLKRGYSRRMTAGSVAVAGSLGILIPPSISFILYSLVTNTSVGKLFMAGILPGILLALLFALYTVVQSLRENRLGIAEQTTSETPPLEWRALGSLAMIIIVLGGIYLGFFTPTEAAAVGVVYALALTAIFTRTLTAGLFWAALRDSVVTSAMILMLIAGAGIFGNTLSLLQVPQALAGWLDSLQLAPWEFLIAVNLLYLVLGMFMDASAAILVTVPILLPALQALNIDLIWFGVILVINMEIGAVTPPVGMNLFVVQSLRDDYSIREVLAGSLPYALMGILGLIIVMLFPQLALFLPNLVN
ncbi:TRAP transporter large permease [Jiella endophytica]|uniref:TRAP transporter large permease n=1 Tax=Jiella endophytica TaxID=2558362 RepID=UPI00142FAB1E|nr:TRAP transporter large permease [Jiella endophytica]